MPTQTLLQLTQSILSALDGDEVDDINDTVESLQVAQIVKDTYNVILASENVPSRENIVKLIGSAGATFSLPTNVKSIKWIFYNGKEIPYIDPENYLVKMAHMGQDNVATITGPNSISLTVRSDASDAPNYWTTFDNNSVYFDLTALDPAKTICWAQMDPVFTMVNSFVPDLDADLFPYLLAEATAAAFQYQKQISSTKDEQRARSQKVKRMSDRWRLDQRRPYNRLPDYGRKR